MARRDQSGPAPSGQGTNRANTSPAVRRNTRQRAAVRKILHEQADFRTTQEIHTALQDSGERIALATVYRILRVLAELGEVDVLHSESTETLYRLCGPEHHHHLMCRKCGWVIEVRGLAIESWADRVAAEHGFTNVAHTVEIFGNCHNCTATDAEPDDDTSTSPRS